MMPGLKNWFLVNYRKVVNAPAFADKGAPIHPAKKILWSPYGSMDWKHSGVQIFT